MLRNIRDKLAQNPRTFTWLRKLIEFNFRKQKAIIRASLGKSAPQIVLDIGCGTGEFAPLFKHGSYFGIDISPKYIEYASQKSAVNFSIMDARHLQFGDNKFDFVLIMAVLHHLNGADADQVLKEAQRVLKASGQILIIEDAHLSKLDSPFVKLIQKYDVGAYIREPEEYRALIKPYFNLENEHKFRSGGCTYYAASATKR